MSIKKLVLLLALVFAAPIFAQNSVAQDSVKKLPFKLSYLDSLKTTYVIDEMTSCVDSMWIKEQTSNQRIFDDLYADIKNIDLDQKVDYELPTDLLKERLRLLDEKSPFNIEYNVGLENIIKSFLKNRKRSFERLMGISQFYFPMFEEAFSKYNVPLEIKYLAVVESALNPKATSRVGAKGLWQFMYETGKQYKLDINSYVDERSDALKASDAAARYMQKMFEVFGDWDLVLASYNSGPGNVAKAIRRSGGHQNYWNIRKNLPKETQGYVPAFLATMYIFEYHKEHGIVPEKPVASTFKTDTIAIKNKMTFKQIADLLDMPEAEIEFLNPSYKLNTIPFVTNEMHYLRLPKDKIAIFTSNEDKMYAYANYDFNKREKPFTSKPKVRLIAKDSTAIAAVGSQNNVEESSAVAFKKTFKTVEKTKYHVIKSGDNLGSIAEKYDVAINDIKHWNHLKNTNLQKGKKLKIVYEDRVAVLQKVNVAQNKVIVAEPKESATENVAVLETKTIAKKEVIKKAKEAKEEVAVVEKSKVHIVTEGESLTTIAKQNKLYVADLKKWNNLKESSIKSGDKLKLSADAVIEKEPEAEQPIAATEDFHTVKKGESIFQIAKLYKVGVDDILNWNNMTTTSIQAGDKLKIEKAPEIIAEKVKKPGKMKERLQEEQLYIVQKGDSLFKISQQHHTTVAQLKEKNNIKEDDLQPGMKLKI